MMDFIEINGNRFTDIDKATNYFEKQIRIVKENRASTLQSMLQPVVEYSRKNYKEKLIKIHVGNSIVTIE